jgi:peptide/nickel transport system permease protein
MTSYILRRLAESLIVLALMSFVVYALIGLMPGDPIDLMLSADPHLTSADVARLKALLGIDQPLLKRYGNWAAAALSGDFGYSRLYVSPALAALAAPLGRTALLMGLSFAVTLAVALPLGVAAAMRPRSVLDHAINLASFASLSLPSFWIGLMLILVFAANLGWLPAGGIADVGGGGFVDRARHLILPVATLTLVGFGAFARYMRGSLREVMGQDFIRTARAKGVSERRVIYDHALGNALMPTITIIGMDVGTLLGGVVLTETVFSIPGMGRLLVEAINQRDTPCVLGCLVVMAVTVAVSNLIVDLIYAYIDPRIRAQYGARARRA